MSDQVILVVDDDEDIRFSLNLLLSQHGFNVVEASSAHDCLNFVERKLPDLILMDMNFSRDVTSGEEGLVLLGKLSKLSVPIILMSAWANIELVVKGMRLGAADFIEKPWHKARLLDTINRNLQPKSDSSKGSWIAQSESMCTLSQLVDTIAPTDANILILGENGTGKSELAARIHHLSQRHAHEFCAVNVAAIPHSLFESELFGHKQGAFTDAKADKAGMFKLAHAGTLFLDEIGALAYDLQPKLLHVLETGKYTPVGSEKIESTDARIIAATNADLSQAVANRQFRQDLYYRLNTFVITLPSLRERVDDILPLALYFIEQFVTKYHKPPIQLTERAKQKLITHKWPGNVRELRQVMERAVIISRGELLDDHALILDSDYPGQSQTLDLSEMTLEQIELHQIQSVLAQYNGNITLSAQALGISRNALYRRIEKYQLADENQTRDARS